MDRLLTKYRSMDKHKQLTSVSISTYIESIRHNINIISASTVMKVLQVATGDAFIVFDGNCTASAAIKCNWKSMFDIASMFVCLCLSYDVVA